MVQVGIQRTSQGRALVDQSDPCMTPAAISAEALHVAA